MLRSIKTESAQLLPGLFKECADINMAYLMELKNKSLLQIFTWKR